MPGSTSIGYDPAYLGDAEIPSLDNLPEEFRSEPEAEGQWPRMLVLSQDVQDRLKPWIHAELEKCWEERDELIEDWKSWAEDYWANPEAEEKNFPFRKAANVVIPLTAIAVEAVYARIINTIFSVEPFWSIRPRSRAWIDAAPFVQKWLQTEVENENSLDLFRFSSDSIMELVKLGTAIGKSGYIRDVRKTKITLPDGTDEDRYIEVRNGATLEHVPLANFLIRVTYTDPQTAPWCGEEHEYTWGELKRMSLSGQIMPEALEAIKKHWSSENRTYAGQAEEYHEAIDLETSQDPDWHEDFMTQEIWAAFDVDGDGVDEEIMFDYHYMSDTILSIRYNWNSDVHRPYRVGTYFPVEGRLYGVGIGKQNEQFQDEITTVHRQRLDNATLANMRMIAIRRSTGYGPGEPLFPGKMWFIDNPEDIGEVKLSEIYPSTHINEQEMLRYSEKRSGVNETILGMQPAGQPGTATGEMARLAEGNKRFDLVLKNVRNWLGLLGKDVLSNFQQFGDQDRHWTVLESDGKWVDEVLQMPPELVRDGAIVELTVTDSITNTQVEQQQWMALFTVIKDFLGTRAEAAMALAQATEDPQIYIETLTALIAAGDEAFKRLLNTFRITNPEALLPKPINEGGANGGLGQPALEAGPQGPGGTQAGQGVGDILSLLTGGGGPLT